VALLLRRRGITQVRPLAGGLEAWRDLGFPMTAASKDNLTAPGAR